MLPILLLLLTLLGFARSQSNSTFNGSCTNYMPGRGWNPPQLRQVVNNASTMFGYQLAGRALNMSQLQKTCSSTVFKWESIGLTMEDIQQPSCRFSNATTLPSDEVIIPGIIHASTNILITQLLNAFAACPLPAGAKPDPSSPFTYLCNNLRPSLLDSYGINNARLLSTVCGAANMLPANNTVAQANSSDLQAYQATQTILFASTLALRAETDADIGVLCDTVPQYASNMNNIGISSDGLETYFCSTLRGPFDDSTQWVDWSTQAFAQVLLGASDVEGWQEWLCANLNKGRMHDLYLDEDFAETLVCQIGLGR